MENSFKFNTRDGQVSYTTKKIKGELECLIIDSSDKVEIIIESELGYIVFTRKAHEGIKYYPLRIENVPNTDNKYSSLENSGSSKIYLNYH